MSVCCRGRVLLRAPTSVGHDLRPQRDADLTPGWELLVTVSCLASRRRLPGQSGHLKDFMEPSSKPPGKMWGAELIVTTKPWTVITAQARVMTP